MPSPRDTFLALAAVACCTVSGRDVYAQARVQGGSSVALEQAGGQQKGPAKSSTSGVNGATVTLSAKDRALSNVLQEISKQANHPIVFDYTDSLVLKKVSVNIVGKGVLEAIRIALAGTGLTPVMAPDGETIVIRRQTQRSDTVDKKQAAGTIRGKVTDSATKQGIAGVAVAIPGTKYSVLTSANGEFLLRDVPVGDHSVTIKLFGYRAATRTVTVGEGKPVFLQVALASVPTTLAGVVTSVTGVQKKLEIGNDVTTINVDSVLRVAPVSTVTDLLETRVPGLTVMRTSGVPGAPSRIRLRGVGGGLLAGQEGAPTNDPIVIVDGIRINASQSGVSDQNLAVEPMGTVTGRMYSSSFPPPSAIDQIDPNSIETIEVFKGPSAAALYGSDAANGVIVITTKRGRSGPTRWSLSANQSVEYLPGVYAEPGYYPFCSMVNAIPNNVDPPSVCAVQYLHNSVLDSVVRFQALDASRLTSFGTGNGTELSGTVSGGVPTMMYSLTGSIGRQLGLLKTPTLYQDFFQQVFDSAMPNWMRRPNRMDARSATASLILEPRHGVRMTLSTRLSNSIQRQSSAQLGLSKLANTYLDTINLQPKTLSDFATRVEAGRFVADNTATVSWDTWQALPMTATIGFSREARNDSRFIPRGIGANISDTLGFYSSGMQTTNTGSARLNGTLLPGRRISAALGTDLTNGSRRQVQIEADSISRGVLAPTRFDDARQQRYTSATGGWFVEPRLNLNSRFFVNPGFRFDGNSLSGSRSGVGGGLWSLFPKLNLSWIAVDREGGAPMLGAISMLRPRVSFGVAGVQPAPGWQLRLMSGTTAASGNTAIEDGGLEVSTLGNTQLRPERTREFEGGFDADLWNGRTTFTFTQFVKLREDAIVQLPVASSVYGGELQQYTNIGRIRNSGVEVTLASTLIENPLVRWAVRMSLSKANSKLLSLNTEDAYIDLGDGTRYVPGYPIPGRWVRPILGWTAPSGGGRLAGRDVIVGDSAVYVGQQAPNFELPLGTDLSLFHGQVSLNATFQYKDGLTQFNSGSAQLVNNLYFNPNATLAEQAAALAVANCSAPKTALNCTTYGLIQTVNSFRFNSLSIGYNVPRAIAQRLRVPSVSIALQGQNLGLWTSYRGKDPDVNGRTVGDATEDNGQLPQPRQWRLQVRMGN